jgi:hypothetical protein
MASEEGSSHFAHSATEDSAQSKSRGRSAHSTWIHSRQANQEDGEDPKLKYCIHCTTIPIYATMVTTNMRAHLQAKHSIAIERQLGLVQATTVQQLEQLYLRANLSSQTKQIDTQVFRSCLNQDVINEALVSLIVVQSLPFQAVEWPKFHALCQILNPESSDFITTAHSQVGKKIKESFISHKDIVRRKLQSAVSRVHISLDVWTSPNGLLLLGIVAHFVDCLEEKLFKALIALPEITNHSGDEQFSVLLPALQDYGIVRKLGAIVGDNTTTNNTLCAIVEEHMLKEEEVE